MLKQPEFHPLNRQKEYRADDVILFSPLQPSTASSSTPTPGAATATSGRSSPGCTTTTCPTPSSPGAHSRRGSGTGRSATWTRTSSPAGPRSSPCPDTWRQSRVSSFENACYFISNSCFEELSALFCKREQYLEGIVFALRT